HPKNVIMLTCDAFGVLPPIARLTPAQAMYHFLSGFTSKVAGTERGVTEPEPTFSTCFGAPFMPMRPEVYGNLLRAKIAKHGATCWLVNTGWTGGAYGTGSRMPIKATRALLTAALDGMWPQPLPAEAKGAGDKIKAKAAEKGVKVSDEAVKQAVLDSVRALMIIRAYRIRGHLAADLDPLGMRDETAHPELDPKSYGFEESDMDRPIFIDNVLGLEIAPMRQIVEIVKRTYCGTFALQYMHISNPEEAGWLTERI
ncbi:phosphoenolpyruvate carboxykinase (ATP), partial [Pseudooceanicola nanhaiensis]|uniref:phosphoenolpyruvate carboxykinase (ATP) n=1 Tax=Pseudooceanicola nanhaiensis TaxID=375761 RepID=UPI0030086449